MNQLRCKQLKSTVVLGFKTLAKAFFTVTVENAVFFQAKTMFNYEHQKWVPAGTGVRDSYASGLRCRNLR
jgi:hypothetical protein